MVRRMMYLETISDSINGLEYSLGPASSEYCVFLLSELAEQVKANGIRTLGDIRIRTRMFLGIIENFRDRQLNGIIIRFS